MISNYTVRSSILPDITKLHNSLRKQDLAEVQALSSKPRSALVHGYLNGPCFTGLYYDQVLCMYGVIPEDNGGRIWMLSSKNIRGHARSVCKISRKEINRLKAEYKMLYNIVDYRNKLTIKWLSWLGFQFGANYFIGPDKHHFKEFHLWQ